MNNFLPWQRQQWIDLHQLYQSNRLPHALLFIGQAGLGKLALALQFAKTLLCENTSTVVSACNHCKSCLWVAAQTHPDLTYITPEKGGKTIKVEQIRQLIHHSNQTTSSAYKIIIINPADSLLVGASHALLKTLEEPTDRTLFILISDKPGQLLATIRSRCQFIRFTLPPPELGKDWICKHIPEETIAFIDILYHLANNAPLKAIEYAKTGIHTLYQQLLVDLNQLLKKELDPIKLAEKHLKTDLNTLLQCLMIISSDVIKCYYKPAKASADLHLLADQLDNDFLLRFFDQLTALQQQTKIALNPSLLLEDLFCEWAMQGKVCIP